MRRSRNSLRLAVSLLLGAMFVVLPMVLPAQAATSESLLTSSPLPTISEKTACLSILQDSLQDVYAMLTPARFERVETLANAVVITQPKEELARSLTPSETVMNKVEEDSTPEVIRITPSPTPLVLTPSLVTPPVNQESSTPLTESGSSLNAEVLFTMVNAYRAQVGLSPFQKDDQICAIAASRAPELDSEIYVTRSMHAGFHARNLPYFATENMISMRTEQEALTWWLNSPVHRSAILGNYKYACVACGGRSCNMIFTNFEPKSSIPQISQTISPVSQ